MQQVCSNLRCSAVITVPEGQEVPLFDRKSICEKCYGKPICAKCDRVLHTPVPIIPITQIVSYLYDDSEEEIIHTYLPRPKPGYAIRPIQVHDGVGGMWSEYVSCRVEPEKSSTDGKLVKRIKKLFSTQRGS
ncbi:hypothetical protein BDR03DRAFT_1089551 [Suillus americanus]|nr:hypothetical protein BDR03DRAFT_1089551 [Suillus americanus]